MRRLGVLGFTLPELAISLSLLGVVMAAIVSVVLSMQRGYVRQRDTARAEDALRVAETTVAMILRNAGANPLGMTGANAPQIDPGSPPFDSLHVISDFNPPNGSVNGLLENVLVFTRNDTLYVRWQNPAGPNLPVAYPVRSVRFEYYRLDGTLITTATDVANAKRVRFLILAPRQSRTAAVLARRETWIQLRNR